MTGKSRGLPRAALLAGGTVVADVVVVGAGPAGTLMAMQLARSPELADLRVVVVDRLARPLAGRWWAYWGREPLVPGADSGEWERLRVQDVDRVLDLRLQQSRYRRLDGDALADLYDLAVGAVPAVRRVVDTVEGVDQSEAAAVVHLGGGKQISTQWVLDSTAGPAADRAGPWLSFLGWRVWPESKTKRNDTVVLMDFDVPQRDGLRFGYVLPETSEHQFLEMCSFRYGGPDSNLARDLPAWVNGRLAGKGFASQPVQADAYPLLFAGSRRLGHRVLAIGHRGGLVRSSTGYGLVAFARDAAAVAESLARHGHPFGLAQPGRRDVALDRIALEVLRTDPGALQRAYLRLFAANPAERVLGFLDGTASAAQVAALTRTLPAGPFLRAAGRLRHRPS